MNAAAENNCTESSSAETKSVETGSAESSSVEIWLWILMVMMPYNPKTTLILSMFNNNAKAAAKAIRDGEIQFLSEDEIKRSKEIRNNAVRSVMKICAENDVQIITLEDERYPKLLKTIENPPVVLFVAGDISGLDEGFTLSVVGTRNASPYGYEITKELISSVTRLGAIITSGLAIGLDSAAHKACLDAGGRTIGVCGCGIMVDYPKGNGALKRRIVDNGGAVISELLPFTKTFGEYFKHRNRIISGLSLGTLVLEAGEVSGCLLTAQHALDQGREVFAVPPQNVLKANFAGTANLIREGAVSVFNYTDIVHALIKSSSLNEYFKSILGKNI